MTARQKTPPVREIADTLRKRISSRELEPGAKLPSTRLLAKEFKVSEQVIYRVVVSLKESGHVIAHQGMGVFVRIYDPLEWNPGEFERRDRHDDPNTNTDDWKAQVRAQGRHPEQDVPIVRREPATEDVARWLKINPRDNVVARRRLRWVDGEPSQIADSYFPEWAAEGTPLLEERDVTMPGGILAATGNPQRFFRDELTTRMPTPEEEQRMDLPPGTPVCQHVRIGLLADRTPVRAMVTICPGDRHVIVYEMEV
ncbi:hypothetical protein GCM10017744_102620 [Streptomyces antimycoticus]|uniref:GntR family transcriptional regulator n=1 Tax=Streptomyces antimycoticus TaxID=68175 RepID=UPI0031EBB498